MATTAARLRRGLGQGRGPVEELRSLRRLLARVTLDELQTVRRARKQGMTWKDIAYILGITESGARKRYNAKGIE